jgi:hypothetical protein
MLFPRRAVIASVIFAAAFGASPAYANAPPVAAPRTPVTVQQVPPIATPAPAAAAAPAPPPQAVRPAAEKPLWRQPYLWALIALADTIAASGVTLLYLQKPTRGVMRLAAALTGTSALFIAAAIAAWLF